MYVCNYNLFLFTCALQVVIICRFLQATVAGINLSQPPCVQISAVRAIAEYCSHLSSTDRTHVLQPFIGNMVDGLLSVMTQFSTDVIALCLETLCVVLEVRNVLQITVEFWWHAVQIRLSTQWPAWSHYHRGTTSSNDEICRSHYLPGLASKVGVTAVWSQCPLL